MRNYYEDLSLPMGASIEQVKKQFRQLALIHHPDKNINDNEADEKFIIINNAYQFLNNPQQKTWYDNQIASHILNNLNDEMHTRQYQDDQPSYSPIKEKPKHTYTKEILIRNKIGTIYAFAIVLGMLLMVFSISISIHYYEALKREELENTLQVYKTEITQDIENQRYEIGLHKIDTLLRHKKYNGTSTKAEISNIKHNTLLIMRRASQILLQEKQAKEALKYLKIIIDHHQKPTLIDYQLIALASKEAQHYHDAIEAWQYIEKIDEPNFETSAQIGGSVQKSVFLRFTIVVSKV